VSTRIQLALAGVILVALCGAAQAKSAECACHLLTQTVHHTVTHRAVGHLSKTAHQARASRTTHKDARGDARGARHSVRTTRRDVMQRDWRYDSQETQTHVTVSRDDRANGTYDYSNAREAREDVYNTRQTYADEQYGYRQDGYSQDGYSYGYGDYRGQADGPPVQLNGRDFSGGVGYGQSGDMGYYQGGYGRFDPYNGDTAGMNGGVMGGDRARMGVWHGYNGHNGLANGY